MHCKLDPLVYLTVRPIIPLRHEMELRPASYAQVYRRNKATRCLFGSMRRRMEALPLPAG
jgi:hypothetical protein